MKELPRDELNLKPSERATYDAVKDGCDTLAKIAEHTGRTKGAIANRMTDVIGTGLVYRENGQYRIREPKAPMVRPNPAIRSVPLAKLMGGSARVAKLRTAK